MFTCNSRDRVGGAKNPEDSVPCDSRLLEPCNGNSVSQPTTLHVPVETVPFYVYQSSSWIHMINPWITGSKCVGKKVRHLTTTLPQLVASDISNFLTALESSFWTALSNLPLTLSDRLPSSRQNDESVPVSWLKRDSENMNSEYDIALGERSRVGWAADSGLHSHLIDGRLIS